ncbi:MAG: hypothetical protein N4A33_01455 [Bacteriovoracaceae bacterium]|jgi:hypothetical protein|nr:hypothetical protein [Bacteriovoracaceae bacterium]
MKILFIFIFSLNLFADLIYKIDEKKEKFKFTSDKLVSLSSTNESLALKDYSSIKIKMISDKGKNPATKKCKIIGGEIQKGISSLNHESYFCKFKDGSKILASHLLN